LYIPTVDNTITFDKEVNKIRKTYKFRVYPSKKIERRLQFTLNNCRYLYNTQL